jgi:hypothetical protein
MAKTEFATSYNELTDPDWVEVLKSELNDVTMLIGRRRNTITQERLMLLLRGFLASHLASVDNSRRRHFDRAARADFSAAYQLRDDAA